MKTGYLAEQSKQLQLAALSIAQGMQAGSFRSHFRGRGIEFDALREYEAGDDIRSIDWNLMARSNKTFVKLYREERDLRLFLIADVSASMAAGCTTQSPQKKLLEAAAGKIVKELCARYKRLESIDLKLVKRNPPMGADCDSTGVELHLINDKTKV